MALRLLSGVAVTRARAFAPPLGAVVATAQSTRLFSNTRSAPSFWDTVLPLIQGNRRERRLQRKQGGLQAEDYERVQRDRRRDEMMAAQSADGEALIDEPQMSFDDAAQRRATDAKREKRLLRKRWGGLTAPGGEEKAEHKYSTAVFRISPRKLNLLANQISGKPIDFAILQMQFSAKRAARRIRSTLAMARDHAVAKGMDPRMLVVSEAWVTKGTFLKRLEIKGRGRVGILNHPQSRMNIVLRPGKTWEEREAQALERARRHSRSMRGGGVVRASPKIVNGFQRPGWAW